MATSPRRILAVDGVEESVASEFRVEVKSDEAALQPAVDREREGGYEVQV